MSLAMFYGPSFNRKHLKSVVLYLNAYGIVNKVCACVSNNFKDVKRDLSDDTPLFILVILFNNSP